MKILYAIQGTGNGHLSRARDIIPLLQNKCEVDILVSGYQADIDLPFPVKYRFNGLSFIFGKKGGVDIWNTYIKANTKRLFKEVKTLPVKDYDFVINDFEPVSAWACYLNKVPCISLSHQAAVLDKNSPKPNKKDLFGRFILKNYAPSSVSYGFHFSRYSKKIFTPVIRQEIREIENTNKGHYTVYLPSYDDEKIVKVLRLLPNVRWKVYSKHTKESKRYDNIDIYPINNEEFIKSMASSTGILCGAGFETPAEAMFLGKKLMVIPMKGQYEQQCNAAALKGIGVPILKKLKKDNYDKIKSWIESDYKIEINYPDITERVINSVFEDHVQSLIKKNKWKKDFQLAFPVGRQK